LRGSSWVHSRCALVWSCRIACPSNRQRSSDCLIAERWGGAPCASIQKPKKKRVYPGFHTVFHPRLVSQWVR
jgi:hypothetical protein